MKIYHNPHCSKSREALKLIKEKGAEVEIIEYMKKPPTFAELKDVLVRLNMKPEQILRKGEKLFKKKYKGLNFEDDEWIQVMVENPKLIERPIVVKGPKAIICRPPEDVLELL